MAALDAFFSSWTDPGDIEIACIGDSTTEGTVSVPSTGGWVKELRRLASVRWPIAGEGALHVHRDGFNMTSGAGSAWTQATTADAWDVSPMLGFAGTIKPGVFRGTTATRILTWTRPASMTPPKTFDIIAVDGASSGNFSYSINGSASWTNITGVTWAQDNSIKRIPVRRVVGTSVKVRCANAAGTAQTSYLMGIDTRLRTGAVAHNLGGNSEYLSTVVRTTAGNWHAWLDLHQPALVTLMFTNDVIFFDIAGWEQRWRDFLDVVTGYGGAVLCMNFFEQNGRSVADQAAMRDVVKRVAIEYDQPYLDFYDLVGNFAVADGLGYMVADGIHPSDTGCTYMAEQIWSAIGRSYYGAAYDTVGA